MLSPAPSLLDHSLAGSPNLNQPYFQGLTWDDHQGSLLLAGMKTVATLEGQQSLHPLSRAMIQATQEHLLHVKGSIEALPIISPETLAQDLKGHKHRQLALQFLILMPYLSMEVQPADVELVYQFAEALQLCPHTLQSLKQVEAGQLRRLLYGYTVRSFAELLPGGWMQKGISILSAIHQYMGDPQVAKQYRSLESLPAGTLGRALLDYYSDGNFPLPGEKGSFSEILVPHDLIHILSGIDTSPVGEITVAGFEAGMSSSQFGFELLLEVILDFHLGLNFTTMGILDPSHNKFIPDLMMQAFVQGTKASQDLFSPDWPFWEMLDQPIDRIRQQYCIQALTTSSQVEAQELSH